MENQAHYTLVGAFVLVLVAALFAGLFYLAKIQFGRPTQPYYIFFTGSVTGLVEGSPARYRGVAVGSVGDIRIDPTNVERVRVTIEVPTETPIKTDSVASLEPVGVTGGVYVEIAGGSREAPLLKDVAVGVPVIPSRSSAITTLLEEGPKLLTNLVGLSDRISGFMTEENQRSVAQILGNLATASADVTQLTKELRHTTEKLGGETSTLLNNANRVVLDAGSISGDVAKTAEDLRRLTQSLAKTSDELGLMIAENRPAVRDFTGSALNDVNILIAELQELTNSLARISNRIERDPSNFLFGGNSRGRVEVNK
jgi:phospholipid/cholesterol/gamma-HCH transport system substrate-binding protein